MKRAAEIAAVLAVILALFEVGHLYFGLGFSPIDVARDVVDAPAANEYPGLGEEPGNSADDPSTTSNTSEEVLAGELELVGTESFGGGEAPTLRFLIRNNGNQSGSIDAVHLSVVNAYWTRVRSGDSGPSHATYDIDVFDLAPDGLTVTVQPSWSAIEASEGAGIQERLLTFGRAPGAGDPEFAWTVELSATLIADGAPIDGGPVMVTVVVNPR